MKRTLLNLLLAVSGLLMVFTELPAAESMLHGATLVYVEEGGGDTITTRFFVNKDYMLIRESYSPQDFILFDRKLQTIHIVTTSEKTIFVIRPKAVNIASPMKLDFKETLDEDKELPAVAGHQVSQYRYFANGELCYVAAVMADNFMPEAAQAMYEFKQVMAGEHATTVGTIPKSMLSACDLALNVFHAGEHFKRGVPVRESGTGGYQRFLKNYQPESELPVSEIKLPEEFERFSIGDILSNPDS